MLLKEFGLDAPVLPRDERTRFGLQTRCMTALFERLFTPFHTLGIWKVLIECDPAAGDGGRVRDLLGCAAYAVKADPNDLLHAPLSLKKQWTRSTLEVGLKAVAARMGWPMEPFEQTLAAVDSCNLLNTWTWRKPLYSPGRRYRAEVICEHEVESMRIRIVIQDKAGNLVREGCVAEAPPDEWDYVRYLRKLRWTSATEVSLFPRNDDVPFRVDVG